MFLCHVWFLATVPSVATRGKPPSYCESGHFLQYFHGMDAFRFLFFLLLTFPFIPSPTNSIDCAGILKLRNADIELKKGETDIGRKNTRVRVVFRVAVPQPDGQALWLQAASVPVECCEWSTQDFCYIVFIIYF